MKKLSRNLRKKMNASNQNAYDEGYAEGYAKGLHDGNPFNTIVDSILRICETFNKVMEDNPELVAEIMEAQKNGKS